MTVTLGQLVTDQQSRDAIHVAVIPVVAGQLLQPGDHVGLEDHKLTLPGPSIPAIGVVDPFLKNPVQKDERCWLFLYPETVSDIRHVWKHPAFADESQVKPTKEESEAWLRNWIDNHDCPDYDTMLIAATGGHLDIVDIEFYKFAYEIDSWQLYFQGRDAHEEDVPDEFYDHVENVTGKKCPHRPRNFTCSC